ncbi:MAG: hypothetical protein C1942_01255 [Prosthecochloris sp.]|uniref:hypothetical protein n=1 Tax=Prosthecochloris sp. TaxID=290513 RepID=UPI0013C8077F|nr:hypothetical protein [Prosthecochloris sp.]NEX11324.1 hypothetical protein [Prosthecochloris sp.]
MQSDVFERFGAKVEFGQHAPGLFMVIAERHDPVALISAYDGTVVMRLTSRTSVIARLSLTNALALQKEPGIRSVGGVNMDLNRYKAFLSSLGVKEIPDLGG